MSVDIGEAKISPLVTVSEFTMVDTKQVQNGGIEIVNMHGILSPVILVWADDITILIGEVVSIFIGLSISDTRLDPSACHPGGKSTGMVIPPVIISG